LRGCPTGVEGDEEDRMKRVTGRVERPVFVVGTGRCGLSLVVDLLGTHEDMAWFSQWTARFPRSNLAPKIPYLYHKPVIRQIMDLAGLVARKQGRPGPIETYAPFTISFRGFANPNRPLTALDVDRNAHDGIYNALLKHVAGQRKQRFIAELSGWARIAFLRQIFPDAQFIHVVRDPRATVNSLLNVDWWDGWRGESNWRYGPIPEKYRHFLNSGPPSFAALASIQYKILTDNILDESKTLDADSYAAVRFEDIVKDTEAGVRRLLAFAGLPYTEAVDRAWRGIRVFNPNEQTVRIAPWRENLTEAQQQIITRICAEQMQRYAYPLDG
jgi:hypothetical protein